MEDTVARHRPRKGVELYSEEDAFLAVVDLAGYDPDDVDCRWVDRRLAIHAERDAEGEECASFHRTIGVPHPVRTDGIQASLADGVLEVRLPIDDGETRDRDIDVDVR